ncbi:MAG: YggS family pyridoxal phosphate-dependent enzyme [Treponema sp.]|jgi:pyridoxal phosphate enzyme (YggS family)|nr:YggS family pyridoxal phosphate-dependent enzyme [Treponema sp.]
MSITEAILRVREQIENARARSGRSGEEVRLCAVSKFHGAPAVEEAYDAGQRLFGESRIQEASGKFAGLKKTRPDMQAHLIGGLQRNKAKAAISLFDCIQSVDRDALIDELGKLTQERGAECAKQAILLEMHTAEASKSGFPDVDALCRAAEKALAYPGLALSGLMTMAPFTNDEKAVRRAFRVVVSARNMLEARFPGHWHCLSMGMSNDFEIAIEEGATLVRVGTAIFGERNR